MAKTASDTTTQKTPHARNPLLSLDTIAGLEREVVEIDGTRYELLHPAELPISVLRKLERMGQDFADVDEDDEEVAERLLRQTVPLILQAPDTVIGKLTVSQLYGIASVFTDLQPAARRPTAPESGNGANRSGTGSKSRRGSRGSTTARRRTTGSKGARASSSR